MDHTNKKWLYDQYCVQKRRVEDISKEVGIPRTYLYYWIKKHGISRPKQLRARRCGTYKVNEKYFSIIDTEEKAYWLGFIAADGCLRNESGKRLFFVELARKDRDHLEKLKEAIQYEGPIYDRVNKKKGYESSILQVCHREMVADLERHGIYQNKTHTLMPPKINKSLRRHWIRGYFDGDGSVSNSPKVSVNGEFFGRKEVMQFICDKLPGRSTPRPKKHCQGWYLSFGGYCNVNKVFDIMYKDATVYLERKKEVFFLNRRVGNSE